MTRILRYGAALAALMVSACGQRTEQARTESSPEPAANVASAAPVNPPPPGGYPPVEPPAPGTPGGLPDDRTPISEAPFSPTSAQGAADVVQQYFALIGQKRYAEAWTLWGDGGLASGMTQNAFVESFDRYESYAAEVGAPGPIEGAAGSLYVEVPVVIYGRLKTGEPVHLDGPIRLRRINDVPGSTESQRRWHIDTSGVRPSPVRERE